MRRFWSQPCSLKERTAAVGLTFLFLIFSSSSATATVVEEMSIEELAADSVRIVHARVVEQYVPVERGPQGQIYTRTSLEVIADFKGGGEHRVTVQQLGGQYGEQLLSVVGNAELIVGEEVVVFLDHDPLTELSYVVGLAQGMFRVNRTESLAWVSRDLHGLSFFRAGAQPYEVASLVFDLETLRRRIGLSLVPDVDGPLMEVRP